MRVKLENEKTPDLLEAFGVSEQEKDEMCRWITEKVREEDKSLTPWKLIARFAEEKDPSSTTLVVFTALVVNTVNYHSGVNEQIMALFAGIAREQAPTQN